MDNTQVLELNGIDKAGEKEVKRLYSFFKRTIDIFLSLIGIIFLLPLTLIVKIVSLLSKDTHKIFFSQERIGKNGVPFKLYKFRTMVPNSLEILENILKEDGPMAKEYKKHHKIEDDPRITKIGKILRKTSLDEFPQFINILKGEMSLIGPRPMLQEEVDDYKKNKDKLLSVRPGLTGYWACNGRSDVSPKKRKELELYYCDNWSFKLDIKIFFRTIAKVIKRDGAK